MKKSLLIAIACLLQTIVFGQDLSFTTTINPPNSVGDCNGTVYVQATGGVSPYSFSIDGASYQASGQFDSLCPGYYDVYVRDSENNLATGSITIDSLDPLDVIITSIPSGTEASGIINLDVFGGISPYIYSISPYLNHFFENSIFYDLSAGVYEVLIQDNAGSSILIYVTIGSLDIDNTLTQDGDRFTTNIEADAYQWYNVDTQEAIDGETSREFKSNELGSFRVEMTFNNDNFTTTTNNSVTVSSPTYSVTFILSIGEITANPLKIYPNPADEYLNVPDLFRNKKFAIYSILGKKVLSGHLTNSRIAIEKLKTGLYFLEVEGSCAIKFMKR
ncbi:T9SS type A sorting domain-containing protein [Dokdonia sp. Hel_I_53]|uniref:T9SS type A sorting domain-containing protein n=1 Tax=Dokdonia sp. Hel_I_53 TaxID=1566287 RepID=UPI00119B572D|nr:T9SS type A sorting domain-containing protein [Dokdonia sp. Hel_I_53]TVZ51646.1 putative secreted protein (Por secretion system target) [Dokdonia sp. Hel_I_53]